MTLLGSAPAETTTRTSAPRRLRSIDVLRGAVLALMLLTPATGAHFPLLRHAAWEGLTISDLVLPTFLVTSGLSLAFLLRPPVGPPVGWRLARRFVLLVVIGLAYNAYGATGLDLGRLRFTGVLQMIGVSGLLAAGVVLTTRRRDGRDRLWVVGAAAALLPVAYGFGLWVLDDRCAGAETCSPYAGIDEAVLGSAHVYGGGVNGYDPEGVVVSVTAVALVLVGYVAGARLRASAPDRRGALAGHLALAGAGLASVAWVLDQVQPVSKRLFTPSFVTVAAGIALLVLSVLVALLDARSYASRASDVATWPFVALGRNALVVYVGERLLLQTAGMVHVGDRTARAWLLEDVLPVGAPGVHLVYTAGLLAILVVVTSVLHARRWYVAL